jgi:4-nitrophenyl phosphatase
MSIPENIRALILDMDGVVWRGDAPIGDLAAIFQRIRERGLKFVFATNNSTKTSEQYVAKLKEFGVEVEPWQVVTSSQAAARAMAQSFPRGTKALVIGEDGLRNPLEQEGFEIVSVENAPQAQVVVMGMDRRLTLENSRSDIAHPQRNPILRDEYG